MPLPLSERILLAAVASQVFSELSSKRSVDDSRVWVAVPCHVMTADSEGMLHPYTGVGEPQYHPIPNGNLHLHGPPVKTNEAHAVTEEVFHRVLGMPEVFPEFTKQVVALSGCTNIEQALPCLWDKGIVDSSISSLRLPGALKCKSKKLLNQAYMVSCSVSVGSDGALCVERGPECLCPTTFRPAPGRAGWAKLFRVLRVQVDVEETSVIDGQKIGKFVKHCSRKAQLTFNRGASGRYKISVCRSGGFKNSELFCHTMSEAMQAGRDAASVTGTFLFDTWSKLNAAGFLPSLFSQLLTMYNGVRRDARLSPLAALPVASVRTYDKKYNFCVMTLLPGVEKVCGRRPEQHSSNNQYIVVDASAHGKNTAILKCHDPDCQEYDKKYGTGKRCFVRLSPESVEELKRFLPQPPLTVSQRTALMDEAARKRPADSDPQERQACGSRRWRSEASRMHPLENKSGLNNNKVAL